MTTLSKLSQFGPVFQTKVIGALITQKDFLVNVSDAIDSEYFENLSHKWIVERTLQYFNQYHTTPSIEVLSVEVKKLDNEILRIGITETLREAYKASDSKDIQWVESEFTNFCRNQQVKKALMTSVDLLNIGDFDGIRNLLNNSLKAGQDKNVGMNLQKDIESRYRDDDRNVNLSHGKYLMILLKVDLEKEI
jgi:replicative DNA helicase